MDYLRRFNMDPQVFFRFSDLDVRVQKHLQKVYATLALSVVVSAIGVCTHMALNVGGTLTTLAAFATLLWLGFTPATDKNQGQRYGQLAAFALLEGCSIGPLIQLAISVNPGIIATALFGTTAVFGSFTLAALCSPRRSYLFLGGLLSSAMSAFLVMRLCGWMFGAAALMWQAELYLSLLAMSLYVIFDTQMIVERVSAGDRDHIRHALDLFIDFVGLLVRIVIILLQNQEKRERERRRKEKRRE